MIHGRWSGETGPQLLGLQLMLNVCSECLGFKATKENSSFSISIKWFFASSDRNYPELLAILIKVWMTLNLMVLVDKVLKVFESVDFFFMLSGVIAQKLKAHLSSHPITSVCIQAEF